jgi:hypothetical protein
MDEAEQACAQAMKSGQLSAAVNANDHLSDDELKRLIPERIVRLGFAQELAIRVGSIALNGVVRKDHEY